MEALFGNHLFSVFDLNAVPLLYLASSTKL